MRTKQTGKILSLLLSVCMVFTLLPVAAFAELDTAVTAQTVEVGTEKEELTVTEGVYAPQARSGISPMGDSTVTGSLSIGGTVAVSDLTFNGNGTSGGVIWAWNAAAATLMLTGDGTIGDDGKIVFTAPGEVTVTVNGTVTATALHHNSYTAEKLTINGSGTLNLSTTESYPYCIFADGGIEIADLTVNVYKEGKDFSAVYTYNGDFTMNSGVLNLYSVASQGIASGEDILIGGTASIKTNPSCAKSALIGGYNIVISGGNVDIISTAENAIQSMIYGGTGVTVSGGTLTTGEDCKNGSILSHLTVNNAAAKVTINGDIGNDANPRNLTVSAGTVTVTGAVSGNINVTGGTVSLKLFLIDSPAYDIPESMVGTAIADINLAPAVKGGTAPFKFSAAGLPEGITINEATGVISGTPAAVTNAGTATITVTDSAAPTAGTESITIAYGEVIPAPVPNGYCGAPGTNGGKDVKWNLDTDTGVLTISGTGNMAGYDDTSNLAPWYLHYKDDITAVVIESGVTNIGRYAFCRCPNISSVIIPSGVTAIGVNAFYGCVMLGSVTIPFGVTIIGAGAFGGCQELANVTISSSVTTIGSGVFKGCTKLAGITIPDGVTSIGENTFDGCTSLSSLTIPDGVTSIGNYAFRGCESLSSIIIPDKVTTIGYGAFIDCTKITSIIIPASVTSIDYYAFSRCTNLASVTFMGTTPPTICNNAFENVAAAGTVTYPATAAEAYKTALASTNIFNWIPIEGNCGTNVNWSLNKSTGILTISGTGAMADYAVDSMPWLSYAYADIKEIVIESGVTHIGDYAFRACSALSSVTIPDSVTTIGNFAFEQCRLLPNITIPDTVTAMGDYSFSSCGMLDSVTIPRGISTIGTAVFSNCINLSSVTIPSGVTSIGNYAFRKCKALSSVTIPDSVTSIDEGAFSECSKLTSIVISCKVTSIGKGAFVGCTNLTGITIPDSVTTIGNEAFSNCTGLSSITIGNSVNVIGDYAFRYCTNLVSVTFMGTTPPTIGADAFNNVASSGTVFCPGGAEGAYATALAATGLENWTQQPIITTYIATLNIYKDNVSYSDIKSYTLKLAGNETTNFSMTGTGATRTVSVPNGTWKVYMDSNVYTGVDIVINNAPSSAQFDQYTGIYSVNPQGAATGGSFSAAIERVDGGNYNLEFSQLPFTSYFKGDAVAFTATGAGADSYTYAWSGTHNVNPISGTGNTYTIDSVQGKVDITCTITGSSTTLPIEITGFAPILNVDAGKAGNAAYANAAAVIDYLKTSLPSAMAIYNGGSIPWPIITWVDTDSYNPATEGSYTFTATLATAPPTFANSAGHQVTVEVVVSPGDGGSSDITNAFIDANFKAAVYAEIGKTALEPILETDVAGITSLDVSNKLIASLAGIEHFTGLTTLYCYGNQLTALPELPTGLTKLNCYSNQLTALPTLPSNLTELYCSSNRLTALDISTLSALEQLYCNENRLTELVLNASASYEYIDVSYNYMADESAVTGQLIIWDGSNFVFSPQYTAEFRPVTDIIGVPLSATVGVPLTLSGTVIPSDATHQAITWGVNDAGTTGATISNGIFTATSAGTAEIYANIANGRITGLDYHDYFDIVVTAGSGTTAVTGVVLNRNTLSLYSNTSPNTATLTAAVSPSNATDKTVTWASSNTAVAAVDQSGNVKAIGNGTAVITATTTDGGYTASCTVTVTAYSSGGGGGNGGNGGGSSSGGNTTTLTTTTPGKKPDQPITAAAPVTATAGTGGTASATIPDKAITDAIAKAQGKTANGTSVALNVTMPQSTTSLTTTLTQSSLNSLVNGGVTSLEINGAPVSLELDLNALKEIQKKGDGNITISIAPATGLSNEAKALIGNRPVYNITISTVKDGKTVGVTNLGNGTAILSIPYTPGKNEAVGYLFGVYVDGKGKATRINGSGYDANARAILLPTRHFSVYGIGYTAPSAKFTDISTHWGKEAIDYVVGRALLSGTSETTFAPNTAMTRGMLVTALGRLAGVDVKTYTTNSFTDVKADSAFRPYIEWAYSKGVVQGIGNQQFAPDQAITREEIAIIFANYAKATGYKLPITREATAYADADRIGRVYKTAVTAMQQAGIMMGGTDNKYNPKASATRAEVSSMLHRYIKLTINPATAQGWALNDDGQYMYYEDGKVLTVTQTINGVKYFFNTDGTLKTGWVKDGDNWRHYSGNKSAAGWLDISDKRYYFTKDGLMVSGKWLEIGGKWYYFNADGSLAKNTKIHGYEVDENGVRKTK